MVRDKRGHEVYVIDRRDWSVVDRFNSCAAASRFYDLDTGTVSRSCREKTFISGEYVCFRYSDDCDLDEETPPKRGESYPIEVYDRQEDKTYKFPDVATAAKALKICRATILYQIKRGKWYQGKLFTRQIVAR